MPDFEVIMTNQVANAAASTALNLQGLVQSMANQKMSPQQIQDVLFKDLAEGGPLFSAFRSSIGNITKNGVEWSSNFSQRDVYQGAGIQEFQWQTASDGIECDDCAARDQEKATLEEWENIGLPKSGFSVCGPNCRCVLVPIGVAKERIRRVKKEKPFIPTTKTQAKRLAKQNLNKAKTIEPKLTRLLKNFVKKTGGQMMGLQYRLKTMDSLSGKIARQSKERNWTLADTIKKDLKDTIRYAVTYEEGVYVKNVQSMMETLKAEGWKFEKIKNTWATKDYHGIGTVAIKNGTRMEIQFHTRVSWKIKQEFSEDLYKQIQALPKFQNATGKQRAAIRALEAELKRVWGPVRIPPGVEKLGTLSKPDPAILARMAKQAKVPKTVEVTRASSSMQFKDVVAVDGTVIGKVSNEMKSVMNKTFEALPPRVQGLLNTVNNEINVGRRLTDMLPHLKGKHPRGWPAGTTWASAEGMQTLGKVYIAETLRPIGAKIFERTTRAAGVFNHEVGHLIDRILKVSGSAEFRSAYFDDLRKIRSNPALKKEMGTRGALRYYTKSPETQGMSEAFAEIFAQLQGASGTSLDLVATFPKCAGFIRHRIIDRKKPFPGEGFGESL